MRNVIFVGNEDVSRDTQLALFSLGFVWSPYNNEVKNKYMKFLYADPISMRITCGSCFVYASNQIIEEGAIPLNGEDVIKNPMLVMGAKGTEKTIEIKGKEYSESTILNALRAYVG